jgi:virginiamycin B lyase
VRTGWRHRVAASVLVLAAAACRSDDGGETAADVTTTEPPPPASATTATTAGTTSTRPATPVVQEYDVPAGSDPHDVAVAADGTVWYTAQGAGRLGRLDPRTGAIDEVDLGSGSRPHGVILGPGGAPWITDGGLNAIVRVDPATRQVRTFPLPSEGVAADANLNTAVFDDDGTLWFTGQEGIYGRLVAGGRGVEVFDAPRGRGPYGIAVTPGGDVFYASLAGNHLASIDPASGLATVLEPPTAGQGTRRVWSDSRGRLWTSQWEAGQVAVYDPSTPGGGGWREWRLPGAAPAAYAVFVDDRDDVWLSDFGGNALVRFDPGAEEFTSFPLPSNPGEVRQIHGRPGEVWGAESAADKLVVVRTGT